MKLMKEINENDWVDYEIRRRGKKKKVGKRK